MLLFSHLESLRKVVRCQSILLQSKGENVHREEEMLGCLEEELRMVLKGGGWMLVRIVRDCSIHFHLKNHIRIGNH